MTPLESQLLEAADALEYAIRIVEGKLSKAEQAATLKELSEEQGWTFCEIPVPSSSETKACWAIKTPEFVPCIEAASARGVRGARVQIGGYVYWPHLSI